MKKEYRKPKVVLVSFQTDDEIALDGSTTVIPNPFNLSPEEGTGKAVFGENGQITRE